MNQNPPQTAVPDGYRTNALGHLVPEQAISEMDLARDELVRDIVAKALVLQAAIREFKRSTAGDMQAFIELAAEKYQVRLGGSVKGNLCLRSFDGRYKAEICVADHITFGPEIHAAKALIDQCIHRWTDGTGAELRALVEHSFQVDKAGNFNVGRIWGLTELAIDDPDWVNAMRAIKDAVQILGSKRYIRLYERREDGKYEQIVLDFSAL